MTRRNGPAADVLRSPARRPPGSPQLSRSWALREERGQFSTLEGLSGGGPPPAEISSPMSHLRLSGRQTHYQKKTQKAASRGPVWMEELDMGQPVLFLSRAKPSW